MGKSVTTLLLLLLLVVCYHALVVSAEGAGSGDQGQEGESQSGESRFLLQDSKSVVKTDAGEMRVVKGFGKRYSFVDRSPMHIGFITMEPNSLFIPQYLDSSLILFIRRGEARIGSIREDELVERRLRTGDVYTIEAGSTFYLENTQEGQRLQVICSIDTSQSLNWNAFESFFIGGGRHPTSIIAGFDSQTMASALNITEDELKEFTTRSRQSGAIISLSPDSHPPSVWKRFLELEKHEKKAHLKRMVHFEEEAKSEEEKPKWSLRKLLISVFGRENKRKEDKKSDSHDTYNLYDRNPDFKNKNGWSLAVYESDYSPLSRFDTSIYIVNLTAGSMMAPHINPRATEYGIVLSGSGSIQIVYPNGSLAMNARVSEGDVFWVPRYLPFCQISSRTGPFEFFGFTTSSKDNHPQFLVGKDSLLQKMRGLELATAFGLNEERLDKFLDAQKDSAILSTAAVAPPDLQKVQDEEEVGMMIPKMINDFGNDIITDF